MTNNSVVIIPTYNAREGIVTTIKKIRKILSHIRIFIVDDNSPDKTAEIVKSAFEKDENIQVLIRKEKGGRGSAVLHGFKEGLKDKKMEYFIEMDADLCHDPKYITQMIEMSNNADMVIASKYLPQSTIAHLTPRRKLMSRLMNIAARIILQVPITDYSNGFRCYRRKVVEYLVKQNFTSKGFVVLSEIVYKAHKKGFSIAEIPFDFNQQHIMTSNFSINEVREAVVTLLRLRFTKNENSKK